MALSNAQKERIIVTAINTMAVQPGSFLVPEIPVGDKGISFDGHIDVMSDASERKESFLGKINVQVKSTEVKEFSAGWISFSFEMADYKNYHKTSGVLLVVGEVKTDGSYKLFFKSLHLMEIENLIREHSSKKSKTVKLQPLEGISLYEVCVRFLDEQKRQPYELVINKPFSISEFQEFKVTLIHNNENLFEDIFNVYGIKNNVHFPLTIAQIEELVGFNGNIEFSNGSMTPYRFYTEITFQKSGTIFTIENAIQLVLDESKETFTYNYLNFCSLSVQLKLIPFLKNLFEGKKITFLDKHHFMLPQSPETVNAIEDYEKIIIELLSTFEILKIHPEKYIEDHEDIMTQFKGLIDIVLHQKYECIRVNLNRGLAKYLIGENHSVLFFKRNADSNVMTNAFSPEISLMSITMQYEPDLRCKHSPYMILDETNLATALNLNVYEIKRSFDCFDPFLDGTTSVISNIFCLRCINAYILSKNKELLELALYIYDKSIGTDYELDDVILINRYQIKKWMGEKLSDNEKDKLMEMRFRCIKQDNYQMTIGINILLENYAENNFLFEKLTSEEKTLFKEYPIYKLMENETQ